MKKIFLLTLLAASVLISSCGFENLTVPKEVSVKTAAKYDFTIATLDSTKNKKLDFSDKFDVEQMISGATNSEGSGTNFNVYQYNDGSEFKQLLLHMPLKEIEFDFGESFKDMDFTNAIQAFEVPKKEFTVPDIQNLNKTQPLDLSNIRSTLTKAISFGGTTKNGSSSPQFATTNLFGSAVFSSGKLIVDATISGTGIYPTGTMTLKDSSNEIIATGTFVSGKAELNFTNATFTSTGMHLIFEGYPENIPFVAKFDDSSVLKKITDVTLPSNDPQYDLSIPDVNIDFPFSLPENLSNVVINQGSLTVNISEPEEWVGNVIDSYNITLTGGIGGESGLTVNKTNPTASLIDQELHNGNINAQSSVNIKLNHATIDFEKTPVVNVAVTVGEISAEVVMEDSFETSIDQTFNLPDEVTNFVTSIKWTKVGFDISYDNNLPEGNNIGLNIKSDYFGITDDEVKYMMPGQKGTISFANNAGITTTFDENDPDTTTVDILGQITLPGSGPGKLKVSHVVPGETYAITISVNPVYEWEEAYIKVPNDFDFQDTFNTNINKKTLFSSLGDDIADKLNNIKIDSLPLYLFANMPDLEGAFADAGFGGKITAYYATPGANEGDAPIKVSNNPDDTIWLLGNKETDTAENLETHEMPKFQEEKNAAGEVTTNFGEKTMDFSDALNLTTTNNDATLYLDYDIGLDASAKNGIKITSTTLDSLKSQGKSKISIDIVLILSLNFNVSETVEIDLKDMMNSVGQGENSGSESQSQESDLLGRSEAPDNSAYEEYLQVIKSAYVAIDEVHFPIKGSLTLKYNLYGNNPADDKEVEIGDGKTTKLIIEDPARIMATYPLNPSLKLEIAQGQFGLKRESAVGGTLKLGIEADHDKEIKIFPMSGSDNNSNNGGEY